MKPERPDIADTATRIIEVIYLIIILVGFVLVVLAAHNAGAAGLVSIFETRYGTPGATRVIPECGCTVKYVGTRVEGTDYFVHFKKLD